jgi:hypothetical protein
LIPDAVQAASLRYASGNLKETGGPGQRSESRRVRPPIKPNGAPNQAEDSMIYRFFNETTRFYGNVFVLSPSVYPHFASSHPTTHKRRSSACRAQYSADCDKLFRSLPAVRRCADVFILILECSRKTIFLLPLTPPFLSLSRSGVQAYLVTMDPTG